MPADRRVVLVFWDRRARRHVAVSCLSDDHERQLRHSPPGHWSGGTRRRLADLARRHPDIEIINEEQTR